MIRVLVVDDSTFMRHALVSLLEQDPEIKVAGTARDGQEALQKAGELDADVMTLDVEMPRLDGLATLQELMKTHPMPVLMVSSLTESGAESTLKAMEYGALDFILKTMSNDRDCFGDELRRKVKAIARKKTHRQAEIPPHQPYRATSCPSQPTFATRGLCPDALPRTARSGGHRRFHGRTAGRAESSFRPAR